MIHSMTAFARTQKQLESGLFCWEIRSVNHRYLDVSFRLPESFRFIETSLRSMLRDKISRGKLECQLKYQNTSSNNQSMLINEGMVNSLVDLSIKLSSTHHLSNNLGVSQVLAWPGVIQDNTQGFDELGQVACSLFNDSIMELTRVG